MTITVTPVPLAEVLPLRELYRQGMNCQIVHDSLPERGFGNLFLLRLDGRVAGYGFVMGYRGEPKDMVKEFLRLAGPPRLGTAHVSATRQDKRGPPHRGPEQRRPPHPHAL